MKHKLLVFGVILFGFALFQSKPTSIAQNAKEAQRISVEEIGRTVVLVGRLGVPLGEKMELTGYWHFPDRPHEKDGSIRFTVTDVNGVKLKDAVEFNHEQLDFTDKEHSDMIPEFTKHRELEDQVWILTAYETGSIQIVPDENRSKKPVFGLAGSRPYYTRPLTTEIVGVLKSNEGKRMR